MLETSNFEKIKFQIFYFRVYNILHTPLLLQLGREDKWFCGRVNPFKYKMRMRNSIQYRYRTNFLTIRAVNEGRIMRSPVKYFYPQGNHPILTNVRKASKLKNNIKNLQRWARDNCLALRQRQRDNVIEPQGPEKIK